MRTPLLLVFATMLVAMPLATAQESAAPAAPAPRTGSESVPAMVPVAPPPGAEIWNNLVGAQDAYIQQLGVPTNGDQGFLDQHGFHPYIQAGTYMVAPVFKNNPATVVTHKNGTGSSTVVNDFEYGVVFTPRLLVGGNWDGGWGVRVGWWYLYEQAPTYTIFNRGAATAQTTVASYPIPGVAPVTSPSAAGLAAGVLNDRVSFESLIHLYVWDWEVTYNGQFGRWLVMPSTGIRYATISQDYRVTRGNSGTATAANGTRFVVTADYESVLTGHQFTGVGPTFATDLVRPIGNSGFRFYAVPRSSFLFGSTRGATQRFSELVETVTPRGGRTSTVRTSTGAYLSTTSDIAMPILETELGLEWSRNWGPARTYIRWGFVDQEWFDAGDNINTHGTLSFVGMALTAGVVY